MAGLLVSISRTLPNCASKGIKFVLPEEWEGSWCSGIDGRRYGCVWRWFGMFEEFAGTKGDAERSSSSCPSVMAKPAFRRSSSEYAGTFDCFADSQKSKSTHSG